MQCRTGNLELVIQFLSKIKLKPQKNIRKLIVKKCSSIQNSRKELYFRNTSNCQTML